MKIKLSYSISAVHETAKFIWENNSSVRNWPSQPKSAIDIIQIIVDHIESEAARNAEILVRERALNINLDNEWTLWTGTGGFYIRYELITSNNEMIIDASLTVDPAISTPYQGHSFVSVDLADCQ